jgi:hypothetical protein
MSRRLRRCLAVLIVLSSPASFAAADDYPIHVTATPPYDDLMMQAAQQISRLPGFQQRYPASRFILTGTAYTWASGTGCYISAGFALVDLRNQGAGRSGDFAYGDTHDLPCPNRYILSVVPEARRIATQIFLGP